MRWPTSMPPAGLEAPADADQRKPAVAELPPVQPAKAPDEPPLVAALRCCLDKRPADAVSRLVRRIGEDLPETIRKL